MDDDAHSHRSLPRLASDAARFVVIGSKKIESYHATICGSIEDSISTLNMDVRMTLKVSIYLSIYLSIINLSIYIYLSVY